MKKTKDRVVIIVAAAMLLLISLPLLSRGKQSKQYFQNRNAAYAGNAVMNNRMDITATDTDAEIGEGPKKDYRFLRAVLENNLYPHSVVTVASISPYYRTHVFRLDNDKGEYIFCGDSGKKFNKNIGEGVGVGNAEETRDKNILKTLYYSGFYGMEHSFFTVKKDGKVLYNAYIDDTGKVVYVNDEKRYAIVHYTLSAFVAGTSSSVVADAKCYYNFILSADVPPSKTEIKKAAFTSGDETHMSVQDDDGKSISSFTAWESSNIPFGDGTTKKKRTSVFLFSGGAKENTVSVKVPESAILYVYKGGKDADGEVMVSSNLCAHKPTNVVKANKEIVLENGDKALFVADKDIYGQNKVQVGECSAVGFAAYRYYRDEEYQPWYRGETVSTAIGITIDWGEEKKCELGLVKELKKNHEGDCFGSDYCVEGAEFAVYKGKHAKEEYKIGTFTIDKAGIGHASLTKYGKENVKAGLNKDKTRIISLPVDHYIIVETVVPAFCEKAENLDVNFEDIASEKLQEPETADKVTNAAQGLEEGTPNAIYREVVIQEPMKYVTIGLEKEFLPVKNPGEILTEAYNCAGDVFELYYIPKSKEQKDAVKVGQFVTDENGAVKAKAAGKVVVKNSKGAVETSFTPTIKNESFTELLSGTYAVVQTAASSGYTFSQTPDTWKGKDFYGNPCLVHDFSADDSSTSWTAGFRGEKNNVGMYDKPIYCNIRLFKTGDSQSISNTNYYNLSGAEYTIYDIGRETSFDKDKTGEYQVAAQYVISNETGDSDSELHKLYDGAYDKDYIGKLSMVNHSYSQSTEGDSELIDLPVSNYAVVETKAPKGYAVCEEALIVDFYEKACRDLKIMEPHTIECEGKKADYDMLSGSDSETYTHLRYQYDEKEKTFICSLCAVDVHDTGSINLTKISENEDITYVNNDYTLAGAEYSLFMTEGLSDLNTVGKQELLVGKFITDDNGVGRPVLNAENQLLIKYGIEINEQENTFCRLPFGWYLLYETNVPDTSGFYLDSDRYFIELSPDGSRLYHVSAEGTDEKDVTSEDVSIVSVEPVKYFISPFEIYKVDAETGHQAVAPELSLEGAIFKVTFSNEIKAEASQKNINREAEYQIAGEQETGEQETEEQGAENQAPEGNNKRTWFIRTLYDEKRNAYIAALDQEHIVNQGEYLSDELFRDGKGNICLPLGFIDIAEVLPPEGYNCAGDGRGYIGLLNQKDKTLKHVEEDSLSVKVASQKDGVALLCGEQGYMMDDYHIVVYESPARGNISFQKTDYETGEAMSGIPFKISLLDKEGKEIESHIAVTDEDGRFDSSVYTMEQATNGNDAVWTYNNGVQENEWKNYRWDEGIYFYGAAAEEKNTQIKKDETETTYKDAVRPGALPYGKYKLSELPCSKNIDRQLLEDIYFEVKADGDVIELGTLTNVAKISLQTVECDSRTGTHMSWCDDKVEIIDTVSYERLYAGKTYTLKGIFVSEDGKALKDSDGKYIRANKVFTVDESYLTNPAEKTGTVEVSFALNTEQMGGRKFTIYEYLYEGDSEELVQVLADGSIMPGKELLACHAEIGDYNQTGYIVDIGTSAKNAKTGEQTAQAEKQVKITDTVLYSGLVPGEEYLLDGIIMLKPEKGKKEKPLIVAGEYVTGRTVFVPDTSSGKVEVEFSFDASKLADKELVVFETLFYKDKELATHKDINDKEQTIRIVTAVPLPSVPVKTGDFTNIRWMLFVAAGAILLALVLLHIKRRGKNF